MDVTSHRRWLRVAILFGILYVVVGIGFAELANSSSSGQLRFAWRLAAWVVSGVVFAANITYEHFQLHTSIPRTALHVSSAVTVGTFVLSVVAIARSQVAIAGNQRFLVLSLLLWSALIFVPVYVVALVAATLLSRTRWRNRPRESLYQTDGGNVNQIKETNNGGD